MNLSFKNNIIQSKFDFIEIYGFRRYKRLTQSSSVNSKFKSSGRAWSSLAKLNHDKLRVKYIR